MGQTVFEQLGSERFEPLAPLGRGGRGEVWRVRERSTGEELALKCVRLRAAEDLWRTKREFRMLRAVRHPNVVRLFELGQEGGSCYYTMEVVDGDHLVAYARPGGRLDERRLRSALAGAASGLEAIHAHDCLHLDVSPRNVMVDRDGRAVILDPLAPLRARGSERVEGTAAYMAPEQARDVPGEAAADWYAFGAVLYECLSGEPPFCGTRLEVLANKQQQLPARPPGPADLVDLCMQLLAVLPADRPRGNDVLQRLNIEERAPAPRVASAARPDRNRVLAAVHAARGGAPSFVFVHAPDPRSLVPDLVTDLESPARVFHATPARGELLPLRTFDAVLDEIAEYLAGLAPRDMRPLLPERIDLLARAFPVLLQSQSVLRRSVPRKQEGTDTSEAVGAAFAGLLAAIAEREGGIVIAVGDSDFGDPDTLPLLRALVTHPGPTAVTLVAGLPLLVRGQNWLPDFARLLERHGGRIDHVVQAGPARPDDDPSGAQLPEDLAELRDILALSQASLPRHVLARAAGLTLPRAHEGIRALIDAGIAESDGRGASDLVWLVDPDAAFVRLGQRDAAVVAKLRRRLAFGFGGSEHEQAAMQLEAAGDLERAAAHYSSSASEAMASLAFGRAARSVDRALALGDWKPEARCQLLTLKATSLASRGHLALAGDCFGEAANLADGNLASRLLARQADCLLRAGRVDDGARVQREVFERLGLHIPATPRQALRSMVWHRARVNWRSRRPHEAAPVEDTRVRAQVDALLSAGLSLSLFDFIRGTDLQSRALLLALERGDAVEQARCYIAEIGYAAAFGQRKRLPVLSARARELVAQTEEPYLVAYFDMMTGAVHACEGQWAPALEYVTRGIERLRTDAPGSDWECVLGAYFARWALFYTGELARLDEDVSAELARAEARGDLASASLLRLGMANLVWLLRDDPDRAERACDRALEFWSDNPRFDQPFRQMYARVNIALYRGQSHRAAGLVRDWWPRVKRKGALRVTHVAVEVEFLRARVELACAADGDAEGLNRAARWIRRLERRGLPWARALGGLARATWSKLHGDAQGAANAARRARDGFVEVGAHFYVELSSLLVAGDSGERTLGTWAQGVQRPMKLAATFVPGLIDRDERTLTGSRVPLPVVSVTVEGRLRRDALAASLIEATAQLAGEKRSAILLDTERLDVLTLGGFEELVHWCRRNRDRLARVAVVGDRPAWNEHFSLLEVISRVAVRTFERRDDAEAWALAPER